MCVGCFPWSLRETACSLSWAVPGSAPCSGVADACSRLGGSSRQAGWQPWAAELLYGTVVLASPVESVL